MNKLTKIEKWFISAMNADPKAPHGLYDLNNPQDWPALRKHMRSIAYHEAGHFVARLFIDIDVADVKAISIIPEDGSAGRMLSENPFILSYFVILSPAIQYHHGMSKLLEKLAGYGTATILDQSKEWESIFEYCECNDLDDEFGNDISEVLGIAKIMSKAYMPVNRILKRADKWTLKMLRIPAVWNAIETVAGKLLEQGEITDLDGTDGKIDAMIDKYCSNVPKVLDLPKWRRWIFPKPKEWE